MGNKTSKSYGRKSPLPRPSQCSPLSKPPPQSKPSPQSKCSAQSKPLPQSKPPPQSKRSPQSNPPPEPSPQPHRLPHQLDHSLSSSLPTSNLELLPYASKPRQMQRQTGSSSLTRSPATDLSDCNTQNPPFSTDGNCISYAPLTTTALFNWKMQYPSFSTNPSSLISLMESIFSIYFPSRDDCRAILAVFFTSEERDRILTEAGKAFLRMGTQTGRWRADVVDCVLPTWRPDWNSGTEGDRRTLRNYHKALLEGMKLAARKPTDFLRLMCVRQRPKESPFEFFERLQEAYREYTPIDPDDPVNFKEINQTFVDHSASDIRNAIQRVYGFEDMTRLELLKIAQRVFDSRESEEEMIIKTMIKFLNNSQRSCDSFSRGQRPQRLRRDQCAYCKRLGHWKNECPKLRQVCSYRGQF